MKHVITLTSLKRYGTLYEINSQNSLGEMLTDLNFCKTSNVFEINKILKIIIEVINNCFQNRKVKYFASVRCFNIATNYILN